MIIYYIAKSKKDLKRFVDKINGNNDKYSLIMINGMKVYYSIRG